MTKEDDYAKRFVRSMRESYPSLTVDFIKERLAYLKAGNPPKGGMDLWIQGDIDEGKI